MTYRDFFLTIVKIVGLATLLHTIFYFVSIHFSVYIVDWDIWLYSYVAIACVAFISLNMLLLIFSHKVVDILFLDKDFMQKEISFPNFQPKDLFRLGLILICSFLFARELTPFLIQSFYALQASSSDYSSMFFNKYSWLISMGSLIIATLGFIYNNVITEFFYSIKSDNDE